MSDGHRFNFFTVNREERLQKLIGEVPGRLTGATVVVDGQIEHMAGLYPNLASSYTQIISSLRAARYIDSEPSLIDDFTIVGFPRSIISFNLLQTVDMVASVLNGELILEIFMNYKDGTSIAYTTRIHTASRAITQEQVPIENVLNAPQEL